MRLVLDASAAIRVVLGADQDAAFANALQSSDFVMAPALFHSEVANTLWKYVRAGQLAPDAALARYRDAVDLVDQFEPDEQCTVAAMTAAVAHQHAVYDMLYLVLARRHACELLTADRKLEQLWRSFASQAASG